MTEHCPYCGEEFDKSTVLARHIVGQHLEKLPFENIPIGDRRRAHVPCVRCWCRATIWPSTTDTVPGEADFTMHCGRIGIQAHFWASHLNIDPNVFQAKEGQE